MKITTRYLSVEILKASLVTLLVLFVILMSNALSSVLSDISLGDAPEQALFPLLLSQSTSLMTLLIPFAYFLGVVFAFGRLYKDYEIAVLSSCGFGYRQMFRPVLLVMLPLLLLNVYLSLSLNASTQRYAQMMVESGEQKGEFETIESGRFNVSKNGAHVFYMESISDDRTQLEKVIITQSSNEQVSIEIAEQGRQKTLEEDGDVFLEVGPGLRYEGFPGDLDFSVTEYKQHGILLDLQRGTSNYSARAKEKSFIELLNSTSRKDRIELHWRIAIPVMLIVLALLAVPLSYVAPRQGRYGKMGITILVYIIYNNFLGAVLAWMEKGKVSVEFGFWWVHLFFISVAIMLLWYRNRGVFKLKACG